MCCSNCGISYKDFRTGFNYSEIYQMYWVPDQDSSKWVYKRRNTILGKWHQIKLELWKNHLEKCGEENERSKTKIDQKRQYDY